MATADDVLAAAMDQKFVIDKILHPAPPPPPLPGGAWKVIPRLSTGFFGKYLCGFNLQGWDLAQANNAVIHNMIGNFARHTSWHGAANIGYLREGQAAGIEALIIFSPPQTTAAANATSWPALVTQAVTQGKLYGVKKYNCSNEPFYGSGPHLSPVDYAALTRAAHKAMKAVDPTASLAAPVTTGNYAGMAQIDAYFAAGPEMEIFDFHPYYLQTPEASLLRDILPLMKYVRAKVPAMRFGCSEVGYTNTPGKGGNNEDDMRQTNEKQTELYPRMIYLHRGCFEYAAYYMLRDHGVNPDNAENNYGVMTSTYSDKPQTRAIRETMADVIPATGAANFNRDGGPVWATRLDYNNAQRLVIWNPTAPSTEKVWVVAQAATTITIAERGGAVNTQPVNAGAQQVSIALSPRAKVLSGIGLGFPEYA